MTLKWIGRRGPNSRQCARGASRLRDIEAARGLVPLYLRIF
jgi:hypothetical protein